MFFIVPMEAFIVALPMMFSDDLLFIKRTGELSILG
jgi:hypothetical protein